MVLQHYFNAPKARWLDEKREFFETGLLARNRAYHARMNRILGQVYTHFGNLVLRDVTGEDEPRTLLIDQSAHENLEFYLLSPDANAIPRQQSGLVVVTRPTRLHELGMKFEEDISEFASRAPPEHIALASDGIRYGAMINFLGETDGSPQHVSTLLDNLDALDRSLNMVLPGKAYKSDEEIVAWKRMLGVNGFRAARGRKTRVLGLKDRT